MRSLYSGADTWIDAGRSLWELNASWAHPEFACYMLAIL